MNNRWFHILSIVLVLGVILVSAWMLPRMPEVMATHWDAKGQVNGTMSRFWGMFLMPLIMLALYGLFVIIPVIDPLRKNIEAFRPQYNLLAVGILVYLVFIHAVTQAWNLGHQVDIGRTITLPIAALIYLIGGILPKAGQNWFVGIRTPWTLSNPQVWADTHRLGGKLYRVTAIVLLLGVFTDWLMWAGFAVLVGISLYLVGYSYFRYRALASAS